MGPISLIWLQFVVCATLIGIFGSKLSRYADVIEEKTQLGGSLAGLVLLATVTSLPELMTVVSAVSFANAPDLAVGNLLGACVLNLTMLVLLDMFGRADALYGHARRDVLLSAAFSILLMGLVGLALLVATHRGHQPAWAHIGISTPIIFLLYGVALRFIYQSQTFLELPDAAVRIRYGDLSLKQAVQRYAATSLIIIAAGAWLPLIGQQLADLMGWSATFTGSLILSLATTLPEVVVLVAALRLGALTMATGNTFGSCLFNLVILGIGDLLYRPGPLLAHVSPLHLSSVFAAILMSAVAIVGLSYTAPTRKRPFIHVVSVILVAIYLLNSYLLYTGMP